MQVIMNRRLPKWIAALFMVLSTCLQTSLELSYFFTGSSSSSSSSSSTPRGVGLTVQAFSPPPPFGVTSMFFPVRNVQIINLLDLSQQDENVSIRTELAKAANFFVDSFWTAKVGGGTKQLTIKQTRDLQNRQFAEFNKRYAISKLGTKSQFFMIRTTTTTKATTATTSSTTTATTSTSSRSGNINDNNIVGCAAVELDTIRKDGFNSENILESSAPLMSNLAISRKYRRRGLAEQLVRTVEKYILTEWPDQQFCYLLVEARNKGAVRLYNKLGYEIIWSDNEAETMMPLENGKIIMEPTIILCMKKRLQRRSGGLLSGRWFGI